MTFFKMSAVVHCYFLEIQLYHPTLPNLLSLVKFFMIFYLDNY